MLHNILMEKKREKIKQFIKLTHFKIYLEAGKSLLVYVFISAEPLCRSLAFFHFKTHTCSLNEDLKPLLKETQHDKQIECV